MSLQKHRCHIDARMKRPVKLLLFPMAGLVMFLVIWDGLRAWCGGGHPGTPPATGGQEVISAQVNPASSRATAVTASGGVLPWLTRCT